MSNSCLNNETEDLTPAIDKFLSAKNSKEDFQSSNTTSYISFLKSMHKSKEIESNSSLTDMWKADLERNEIHTKVTELQCSDKSRQMIDDSNDVIDTIPLIAQSVKSHLFIEHSTSSIQVDNFFTDSTTDEIENDYVYIPSTSTTAVKRTQSKPNSNIIADQQLQLNDHDDDDDELIMQQIAALMVNQQGFIDTATAVDVNDMLIESCEDLEFNVNVDSNVVLSSSNVDNGYDSSDNKDSSQILMTQLPNAQQPHQQHINTSSVNTHNYDDIETLSFSSEDSDSNESDDDEGGSNDQSIHEIHEDNPEMILLVQRILQEAANERLQHESLLIVSTEGMQSDSNRNGDGSGSCSRFYTEVEEFEEF